MKATPGPNSRRRALATLTKLLSRKQWEALRTVLDAGSQTVAAERLGVTHDAVSTRVSRAVEKLASAGHDVAELRDLIA